MKYFSQTSGYRLVHFCLLLPQKKKKKEKMPQKKRCLVLFFKWEVHLKKVYLHITWISSGITAMFRTQLLNKYILRCK